MYDDLATWQAAVGSYNRDTLYGSELSSIGDLTLDDGTYLDFGAAGPGSDVTIYNVGSLWATWSGGYSDDVLYSSASSLSVLFGAPIDAFGFFSQPNSFDTFDITLLLTGGGTLTQSVSGSGGAKFFGFTGDDILGYQISIAGSEQGFALGDFYTVTGVPEPATWAMMIFGFGAAGFALRRNRRRDAIAALA